MRYLLAAIAVALAVPFALSCAADCDRRDRRVSARRRTQMRKSDFRNYHAAKRSVRGYLPINDALVYSHLASRSTH
ncbi:MAG TPA: hypothetical protein V6C81_13180 [Planktothrix sp.]|jgi:hypothetical protein